MSRPYFKNDLFHFTSSKANDSIKKHKRQQKSNSLLANNKQLNLFENSNQDIDETPIIKAHEKLTISLTKQKDDQGLDMDDQLREAILVKAQQRTKKQKQLLTSNQNQKQQKNQQKEKLKDKKNRFVLFTPKNSLKIPEVKADQPKIVKDNNQKQQWKMKMKQKFQMSKLRKQFLKVIKIDEQNLPNQSKQQDKNKQQNNKQKQESPQKKNKQSEGKQEQSDSQSQKKEITKRNKSTNTRKQKRIKKQANYVRTDLKRRYRDRFVGQLNKNLRKLTKSGKLKAKYRKLQTELQMNNGELYNSYTISLSKALFVKIDLNDESDEQFQQSGKLYYTIPETFQKQNLERLIKSVFGFEKFRQGQYETIKNILQGRSTLFVSQTASGKSLTYVVSSIILKGLSIIISPLVSLMLDQIDHLPSDIPAACISSLLNYDQKSRIIKMVKQGKIQLLYITPENFLTDFMYHVRQFPTINFVCIDQAHSMSELSHSFRASYLSLQEIVLKYFRYRNEHPVVLCLTATANKQTMESICQKLNITQTIKSKTTINKNLFITISREYLTSKYDALCKYLAHPQIRKCKGILIYCRTKKIMYEVFNYLRNSSHLCFIYHSALSQKQKVETLQKFRKGEIKIVIATIALGMGLDFQNLQCVIHMNMPKSVQNYIQQIGRAGRRSKRAYCHLFLDKYDYFTQRNYLLADQLDSKIYKNIIQLLGFGTECVKQKRQSKTKQKKGQNINGCQKFKRLNLNQDQQQEIQQIFQQQEQVQKSEKHNQLSKQKQVNSEGNYIKLSELSYCKAQTINEKSGLKQQAILNILIKMQKILGQNILKVLPMSYETIKISFFKKNQDLIKQQSQFYSKLVSQCKVAKGTVYVPLIKKCNQLRLTPIRLISEVYGLSNKYCLKIELVNDIFVWQCSTQVPDSKSYSVNPKQNLLNLLADEQRSKQIIQQFNLIQRTSLIKLNIFYSLCFNNSMKNISHLIDKGHIISAEDPLPSNSIIFNFDKYFGQQTYLLYNEIVKQGDIQENSNNVFTQANIHKSNQSAYLPITIITQSDALQIKRSVELFIKHIITNNPDKKLVPILAPYRDGRIMTRVFMGVNDTNSNWKTYGQHPYWMKFVQKDYRQLLATVKNYITQFVINEGVRLALQENNAKDVGSLKKNKQEQAK